MRCSPNSEGKTAIATYDHVLKRLVAHVGEQASVQGALTDVELDENADLVGTLGLDSTILIQLLADVEDEFDISVPLNQLADIRTLGELARLVHRITEES
ncbi:MAG: acyl carrier protein [Longimicrobiales bacterium]